MNSRKARRAWTAARRRHIRCGHGNRVRFTPDPDCLTYSPARVCTCDAVQALHDEGSQVLATVEGAGPYDPLELLEVGP